MNSLSQYLELYRTNADAINDGWADYVVDMKHEALELLAQARLPRRGEENFERTSVDDMFAADYGVNVNRVALPVDVAASFKCDVPNMSTLMAIVVNDEFHPLKGLNERLPEGVTMMSLRQASTSCCDLVKSHLGSLATMTSAPTALNTLLMADGVFIHIAKGVKLEKPLQIVNILSSPTSLMAPRRMLIVMEEGASAQILVCDHTQDDEMEYLSSQVIELDMAPDSHCNLCVIEESSPKTITHSQLYTRQAAGSRLNATQVTLTNGISRNEFLVDVPGNGCQTLLSAMAIGSGSQHIDNFVNLSHTGQYCHSSQLFKYVLDDDSTGAFCGRIHVAPGAVATDAYQTNRNILASPRARVHSKPQLEIYTDDVKCSHGATTGQLDNEALFYMRTRGIPESEARHMLMQAFMTDVIERVEIEGLRDRLRHLVDLRFAGKDSLCGECNSTCAK